jgi:hypothetical protein
MVKANPIGVNIVYNATASYSYRDADTVCYRDNCIYISPHGADAVYEIGCCLSHLIHSIYDILFCDLVKKLLVENNWSMQITDNNLSRFASRVCISGAVNFLVCFYSIYWSIRLTRYSIIGKSD